MRVLTDHDTAMDRVPEEVLQLILEHVPSDPDPVRLCTRLARTQWNYPLSLIDRLIVPAGSTRTYQLLRVQRRWFRILLRLLYTCVTLTQPHHAAGVLARLQEEPHLGLRVRTLWMHAGTAREWARVVSYMPHVSLLYLNADVLRPMTQQCTRVLAALNPTTAYIHWRGGDELVQGTLTTYVRERWTNLESLHLNNTFPDAFGLAISLRKAKNLRKIEVNVERQRQIDYARAKTRLEGTGITLVTRQDQDEDQNVQQEDALNTLARPNDQTISYTQCLDRALKNKSSGDVFLF